MHVVSVEKAIEMEQKSVSVEHISRWLDKYDRVYAASPCSCRMSRAKLGEGCGDDPEDWCIAVGDMAKYIVETGRGRYIDREEAMSILKKAEDNGFVHQITNIDGEQKILGICNCNVNICNALRTSQLFNTPNLSRSAYVAEVKTENCVACGRCVEVCPARAVKLGQKLCAKDGAPIQYPRHELPDETPWGPDKWDVDYRDNNRINCYDTGTAPCKTACPAHIAVQGYLKLAAQGKYTEALELIKRENPFPAVCGRVCNRRCEDACTRGAIDQAVAIDAARTAHRSGADSVQMYCLEPRDKMPASLEEIAEAEDEDVTIQCGWGPKEVLSEGGKVSGIVFMRCTSVWDDQGRFAPQYDEQDTVTVPCDYVVLSIGQSVEWGELLESSKVELDRGGWAKADSLTDQTAQPDIFVGGDVYTGPKFAIDAIAAGKEAAVSLHRFVQPNTSLTIGRNRRQFIELDKRNIKVEQYDTASRQIPGMDGSIDWKKSFRDAKRTFTEEQVKAETARCLGCGASVVDPNKCIGCGVCTTKCTFDAIHLHRERPECSTMVRSENKMKAILPYTLKRQIKIKRAARKNKK